MLRTKARLELNHILDSLRHWETATPPRARRFHAVRHELETQVRLALSSWWPWVGDEVIERYRDRMRRIDEVAESLVELIDDAERLETEVRALESGLTSGNTELSGWMRDRCRDWVATLGHLGTTCDRTADLFAERNVLVETEKTVRLHDEVVRELREVDRVIGALGEVRAVALSGRLPEFRKRLYESGATLPWLTDLRSVLEPLKTLADRVTTPPPELRSLTQALTEARSWSNRLGGEGAQELQLLAERKFTAIDSEQDEVQKLVAEANALLARLVARANEVRSEKLTALRLQMNDLRRACGPQAELDEKLAQLEGQPSDHPQLFREWLNDAEAFLELFHAIAQTHHGDIEKRVYDTIEKLEKQLTALDTRPLSQEVRKRVTLVRRELDHLPHASDSQEMLRQLRHMAEIEQEIAGLTSRAAQELVEIDERQQQLSLRNDVLQSEAQRVKRLKIETSDLSAQIAALSDRSVEVSLEDRRRQIDDLALALDELEAAFVERCREVLAARVAAIERTIRALRSAGMADVFAATPVIDIRMALYDVTGAVLAARQQHEVLLQKARAVAKELETARQQMVTEIGNLPSDDLGPADRETAAALLQELTSGPWSETRVLLERIERIAAVREKSLLFFERLRQEEQSARERHAELQVRLREFNNEQLHRFCPELADRVTALVYGIPAHPRQWAAVHHQLDVASELFHRIDTHARRLAADELHRAAETLRQRMNGSAGASFRTTAQALLEELDARSHETLAPASLRLRVVGASKRRG